MIIKHLNSLNAADLWTVWEPNVFLNTMVGACRGTLDVKHDPCIHDALHEEGFSAEHMRWGCDKSDWRAANVLWKEEEMGCSYSQKVEMFHGWRKPALCFNSTWIKACELMVQVLDRRGQRVSMGTQCSLVINYIGPDSTFYGIYCSKRLLCIKTIQLHCCLNDLIESAASLLIWSKRGIKYSLWALIIQLIKKKKLVLWDHRTESAIDFQQESINHQNICSDSKEEVVSESPHF